MSLYVAIRIQDPNIKILHGYGSNLYGTPKTHNNYALRALVRNFTPRVPLSILNAPPQG